MARAFSNGLLEILMMENLKMTSAMATERWAGLMAVLTPGSGLGAFKTDTERCILLTDKHVRATLKITLILDQLCQLWAGQTSTLAQLLSFQTLKLVSNCWRKLKVRTNWSKEKALRSTLTRLTPTALRIIPKATTFSTRLKTEIITKSWAWINLAGFTLQHDFRRNLNGCRVQLQMKINKTMQLHPLA